MKKFSSGFFKFSALSAGSVALVMAMKRKKIEPVTLTKKAVRSMKLTIPENKKYQNAAALTPPMGWSSWNTFRNNIDENLVLEVARAMKESGLIDAGYTYVNIDDCWQSSIRDENERLQGDFVHFSNGIKNLVEQVNALGIKLGIYSSNGTLTCEDLPASLGYEAIDAKTFAEWGIEYFKYDFCHNVPIPMRAPYIESISVSKAGSKDELIFNAQDAVLIGEARIADDEKLKTGQYIAGLTAGGGAVEFNDIEVDSEGEYILTLNIRKKSNSYKYFELLVNAEDLYSSTVPPTKAWSAQGRQQMKINLLKGKNTIKIYNPVASRQDSAAIQYIKMGEELISATQAFAEKTGQPEKPIVYSICEWGVNLPWNWGKQAGNLWRTTPDIKPYWVSVLGIYEINVLLHKHSQIGAWNDPDMLEVGNGNLTYNENVSHFTLWCMMAAPLILGNDVREFLKDDGTIDMENEILKIITNKDMIAVDQDALGIQCRRFKTNGICDTLVKPLENNELALCFFNKGCEEKVFEQNIQELVCQMYIDLPFAEKYEAFDLWEKTTEIISNTIYACVPAHGVKVFRIKSM